MAEPLIVTVNLKASPTLPPPAVEPGQSFILLTFDIDLDPSTGPAVAFDLATNSTVVQPGGDLRALGALLHELSHTILAGEALDLNAPVGGAL